MSSEISSSIKYEYQNEQVARSYDRDRFASLIGRTLHLLEARAIRRGLAYVRRTVERPATLDAPCGTGRITDILIRQRVPVVAADISREMMAVARERCAANADCVRFVHADLEHLDFDDRSFDLVTCIRLFHHLDSAARTGILRELGRVTRHFVLINVSLSTPFYRRRRALKRALGQGVSRASATWDEIDREARGAGLRVERQWYALRYASEDVFVLLRRVE